MEEIKLIDISTPKKLKETLNQLREDGKDITEEEKAYWNAKVDPAQLEELQQELNTSVGALNTAIQDKASTGYVEQLVGDINTLLDTINGEVI